MLKRGLCAALLFSLLLAAGCDEATRPPHTHILISRGGPYERGFEHGRRFSAHIRSLYTRLLQNSIMPYLNREQMNIAPVLPTYFDERFLDGQFSYQMLLESGQSLLASDIPEEYEQEMRGIADGSGVPFDEILILNTFFDTMMAFRAITLFIQGIQEPHLASLEFVGGLDTDGADNDGDGEVDEEGEGLIKRYESSTHATMLEVPVDARLKFLIEDPTLLGLACADPRNVDPRGDQRMLGSCIKPDCVPADRSGEEYHLREQLNDVALACLWPRVNVDCIVPECLEGSDPGCVNPEAVRVRVDETLYTAADDPDGLFEMRELPVEGEPTHDPEFAYCQGGLEVTFAPPGGFQPAEHHTILLQAGDLSPIYSPAPFHHRQMRDERISFTTVGYHARTGLGSRLDEIENRGSLAEGGQPPSVAFGVRGSATASGEPLLAHHFSLLDSDLVHEHSLLHVIIPDEGKPHVVLGYTGLIWGLAGMNADGLTFALDHSDTLDNPLVGGALEAIFIPDNLQRLLDNPDLEGLSQALADVRMLSSGLPVGMMGRQLLEQHSTAAEAVATLYRTGSTFGWNILLADASGDLTAVELDSATRAGRRGLVMEDTDGFVRYGPDASQSYNLDSYGRPWASVGPDDLRIASHFRKNEQDMVDLSIMGQFEPPAQRNWSAYYYRSVRSFYALGDAIEERYGSFDVASAVETLRLPALVDDKDSMQASVFEPARRIVHWAMGSVPATSGVFVPFDLAAAVGGAP